MSNVLEVHGLTVNFGGVRAVDDVTFQLRAGQVLGVIGPNGAGKTTMFDAISGFVTATGRVALDGKDISGASPERRSRARLGRSFQDARLFPSLTVAETLSVALERHIGAHDPVSTAVGAPWVRRSERRARTRVDELIELMALGAFRDKFVSELSTGSRRIVDLAVIMAHEPRVLLLDEPSSGIAQRETEALGPMLLRIRDETGASLIVIEHDMPMITSISDELLALETGHVIMQGLPADVIADPRIIASYLGTDQDVIERSGTRTSDLATNVNGAANPNARRDPLTHDEETPTNGSPKPKAAKKRTTKKKAGAKKKAAVKKTPAKKKAAGKKAGAKKKAAAKRSATKR